MSALGPYELNQIYTGDARELSKAIPDESIDLVITDPPYWVGFDYGRLSDDSMDYIEPNWIVSQSSRVSKITLITPGHRTLWDYPKPDWMMAWDKQNSMKRYGWGFCHFEPILCYGKPNIKQSKMRPDIYKAAIIVEKHSHACPKPLKLFLELIQTFTNPGDTVCDFFVGSGTTAVACKILNRNYLAFEIDPDTAALARQRVANTQPPLPITYHEQGVLL